MKLENLFSPLKIGTLELKNRLAVSAMSCSYCEPMNGQVTDRYIKYYEAKAKGGWGLLITEYATVSLEGKACLGQPGLWEDAQIEGHKRLTEAVHQNGSKIFAQLHHAGREAAPLTEGQDIVSASAVPSPVMPILPRELTTEEVEAAIEKFSDAAVRAKKAGYDGVEVHGAHGYFIAQFLSLSSNKRSDKYGGSLTNRGRILTEIITQIKQKCGADYPVTLRISADEATQGGNTIEDTKVFAAMAEEAGADAIHVSVGSYFCLDNVIPNSSRRHGWLTDNSQEIKNTVSIPVIVVGRINDPLLAENILKSGKADAIAMGRGSLADPELPNKAKEGRFEEINSCIGCLQGCFGHVMKGLSTACILNPATGREAELAITPAEAKKKVFIAGGGPSGMEAAIVAAKRGHQVELFEKSGKLGGQFQLASVPPYKGEINTFIAWQKHQLELNGVTVHMNTELTADVVDAESPDTVIVSTGAVPSCPPIDGISDSRVVSAHDVLAGKVLAGANVVIIGGGQVGAETANHLAMYGKQVTIVEMLPQIAQQEEGPILQVLMKDFKEHGVKIYVETAVQRITAEGVEILPKGQDKLCLPADTIVIATGSKSVNTLAEELRTKVGTLIVTGDANAVSNAETAILDGYKAGLQA